MLNEKDGDVVNTFRLLKSNEVLIVSFWDEETIVIGGHDGNVGNDGSYGNDGKGWSDGSDGNNGSDENYWKNLIIRSIRMRAERRSMR